MRRTAVALAFVLSAAAFAVGSAGSATSKSTFAVFVEETTSAASNGLTLNSALEGSFDVAAKTATGDGVYEVRYSATNVSVRRPLAPTQHGRGRTGDPARETGSVIRLFSSVNGGHHPRGRAAARLGI
jgi:hypothetical protein